MKAKTSLVIQVTQFSQFVGHTIWLRHCISPHRFEAHRLPKDGLHRSLLVPMGTTIDLRQITIKSPTTIPSLGRWPKAAKVQSHLLQL